jgi:hypothetical protein
MPAKRLFFNHPQVRFARPAVSLAVIAGGGSIDRQAMFMI